MLVDKLRSSGFKTKSFNTNNQSASNHHLLIIIILSIIFRYLINHCLLLTRTITILLVFTSGLLYQHYYRYHYRYRYSQYRSRFLASLLNHCYLFIKSSENLFIIKRKFSILKRLFLITMISLAISDVKYFVNANTDSFTATSSTVDHPVWSSNFVSHSKSSAKPQSTLTDGQRKMLEKHFLKIMGLNSVPRPAKHQKVPDYFIDLYRWFQEGDINFNNENDVFDNSDYYINNVNDDNVDVDDDEDNDILQFKSSNTGLTTDDLMEIQSLHSNEMDRFYPEINHKRINRKRRAAQLPRVTLNGPSNTIISHTATTTTKTSSLLSPSSSSSLFTTSHNDEKVSNQNKESNLGPGTELNEFDLKFDVKVPNDEILMGAELRLYRHSIYEINLQTKLNKSGENRLESMPKQINYKRRINIYHRLAPKQEKHLRAAKKLIDTQVIDVRDTGWLSFDVYPAVDRWLKHPNENYGLLITILIENQGKTSLSSSLSSLSASNFSSSSLSKLHSQLFVFNSEYFLVQSSSNSETNTNHEHQWHEMQPLIITFSNNEKIHRHNLVNKEKVNGLNRSKRERKRFMPLQKMGGRKRYHKTSRKKDYCRRHQMFVDFKEIGWTDWIVAPPGYQAYHCQGECSYPMPKEMNKTNHAIIQSLINSVNPEVVPEPCCVPTELTSITLLYMDQNKMVLKNYADMVVEGCGCS